MARKRPNYSRIHDPEAQRTRVELWMIIAIVVVVIVGSLVWRSVNHKAAKPRKGWDHPAQTFPSSGGAAPAAAVVKPPG